MKKNFVEFQSQKMRNVYEIAAKVAPTGLHILLSGESGCGKSTIAEYIHSISNRTGSIQCINHIAFEGKTNIENDLIKYFELAKDGTLLIDDVSYCSMYLQNCILKICRDMESGLNGADKLNVRLIGITTRDLHSLSMQRRFRKSLVDRFIVPINIPPLRELREDILPITEAFVKELTDSEDISFSKEATDTIYAYNWPGNIRELESTLKYVVFSSSSKEITLSNLPQKIKRKNAAAVKVTISDELYKIALGFIESGVHLEKTNRYEEYLKAVETPMFKAALDYAKGNKSAIAKLLKINRNTVSKKLKSIGLTDIK